MSIGDARSAGEAPGSIVTRRKMSSASAACPSVSSRAPRRRLMSRRSDRADSGILRIQPMTVAISPRSHTPEPLFRMTSRDPLQSLARSRHSTPASDRPRSKCQSAARRRRSASAGGSSACSRKRRGRGRGDGTETIPAGCPAPPGTSIPAPVLRDQLRVAFARQMVHQIGAHLIEHRDVEQQLRRPSVWASRTSSVR